ncbi:MAG: hypothetical protein HOP11_03125 [Saprospiraceae bacterium]|nr:hypothetical protein [Saprospiraceae bacterium]
MKAFIIPVLFITAMIVVESCLPPIQEDLNKIEYSLSDPLYQKIKDFQDRRLSDSLYSYLSHPKATYRMLASEAFGSYQDSLAIPYLIPLLKDNIEVVRQKAAYSLGQIGHKNAEKPLIQNFIPKDSAGPYQLTNTIILEALGKCGTDSTLQQICKIQNYKNANSQLLEGQILCFYRFGLRNKICQSSLPLIIEVINNKAYPEKTRLIAAHCLQRLKGLDVKNYYKELRNASFEEKNPLIRMAIISAFSRTNHPELINDLEELYTRIQDSRVQCNLIKGLQNLPRGTGATFALKAIHNPSIQISELAGEFFAKNATEVHEKDLLKLIYDENLNWLAKSHIYKALIRITPAYKTLTRDAVYAQLIKDIQNASNEYSKAAYISALENSPRYLQYILQLAEKEKSHVVINNITTTLQKMHQHPSFPFLYPGPKNYVYYSTTAFLSNQIKKHDVGSLAIIAEWFRNEKGPLVKFFKPDSSLKYAQSLLSLPRDIETYNEIENTISQIKKVKFQPKVIEYNTPISWTQLVQLKDTIAAEINTEKGKIEIELYSKIAPASVANFLKLIQQNYFNNKIIHRVVPNFVIQIGCPRGDGYGSLDYSLRTEVSTELNYMQEGVIGMANAGPDTECNQFFITYSPTPHLDGKYSVFGKMNKGMDIMNQIIQGDKITGISIK